jgi:ubiquinone biosynthesis protein
MDALAWVIVGITIAAFTGGAAVAVRRLLGVRFGLIRLALAAVLALLVAGPISRAMSGAAPVNGSSTAPLWFLILAFACSLLAVVIFLVVAEALVPTGSVTPVAWVRGLRSRLARSRRYAQITAIAVRHGLGPYLRGGRRVTTGSRARLARSLREALDEGGLTFVKLGQALSTRRDLLPAEFVAELGALGDQVTPVPWPQVEQVLGAELGVPAEEVFVEVDGVPLER